MSQMSNPFRNDLTADYSNDRTTRLRWEKTRAFLNPLGAATHGLDLGDRTPFTDELAQYFSCPFENTEIDLDIGRLKGEYDIITAFEIIEHLYNPLHCLLEVRRCLKPGGRLYLSTPLGKPNFLWSPYHFHEMSISSLRSLFARAGFKIIRSEKFRVHSNWFYLTGLRPLLRGIFESHILFELISSGPEPVSE